MRMHNQASCAATQLNDNFHTDIAALEMYTDATPTCARLIYEMHACVFLGGVILLPLLLVANLRRSNLEHHARQNA